MVALPSPTQVAGTHSSIYEAYYNMIDPNGLGSIGGMEAARFLKKSGLSDVMLSQIWDLSDPSGRGCLDRSGMFVALKLVALVQNGHHLSIKNINLDVPPPKMGDVSKPKATKPPLPEKLPQITSLPTSEVDWSIKPKEQKNYEKLFHSLQPTNGFIPGAKVKNVLLDSNLPLDTLGKIWDLADQDKDGMLDKHEFIAAMHLVYKALEKYAIPNTLPTELMRPVVSGNQADASIQSKVTPPTSTLPAASQTWVVTTEEKAKSDTLFIKSDVDKDGFVSGIEIKDVFLQSGVPQSVLAHIWALCDINQRGKLNNEQFALAMWLVARCLKGIDPPATLTAEMVPPSLRSNKASEGIVENNNTRYSNPDLDIISKDIDEFIKEKITLETEIAQKEADIRIKNGEVKNLQSELDTLAATLKQLENQKGEASKRLNDLRAQVEKLQIQATEQSDCLILQEAELNSKKEQLEELKKEEKRIEEIKTHKTAKLENITLNLQETQLNISQTKAIITQLEEQCRQMEDAIQACDSAVESGDPVHVPITALEIIPSFRQIINIRMNKMVNENRNKLNGLTVFETNARNDFNDDPFKNDPFKNNNFSANDPFNSTFANVDTEKDAFGCDPFAILHAPTRDENVPPRPTSPSPALPPKSKTKQAPPRPAPPRPTQPPNQKKQSNQDVFGAEPFASSDGFADFSNFETKFSNDATTSINKGVPPSSLNTQDFVVDPFRDYRYEDPFNITFDEEHNSVENFLHNNQLFDNNSNYQDKFESFRLEGREEGRQSVPPINLRNPSCISINSSGRASAPFSLTQNVEGGE